MAESAQVAQSTTRQSRQEVPGCISHASLFQDPLVEEPPRRDAPTSTRRHARLLAEQAAEICAACPLRRDCLYEAVVDHDVAGIVAGTTQRERAAIRRELDIIVEPESFDAIAGVSTGSGPVDHDAVVRLHRSNPGEPLDSIANRLGCSPSTVKRHLRQERDQNAGGGTSRPALRARAAPRPTRNQVMQAAARIVQGERSARRAA